MEKTVWREIDTFSDFKILKTQLKTDARNNGEKLTDDFAGQKALDIQYCLRQAKDYFSSSKSATLLIKPTLIYYGIISLAAALIIFKKRDKSLHSLREGHGLKDKYPDKLRGTQLTSISRDDILKISVEFRESGTFKEFASLNLRENFSLPIKIQNSIDASKDFEQIINFSKSYPSIGEVNLSTIFQNLLDVWKETKILLKKEAFVYQGEAVLNQGFVTCRVCKDFNNVEDIRKNFSFAEKAEFSESNNFFFFTLAKSDYTPVTPLTKRDSNGIQYFTADKNNPLVANDFILF